jgi:hypothetical protein
MRDKRPLMGLAARLVGGEMLFRIVTLALAMNLVGLGAAHAKGCPNGLTDAKKRIASISRSIAGSIHRVEDVPASEAAYIDAESKEARAQGNQERLDVVTRHPFYRAHQVAVAHQQLAANLSRVEQQSERQQVAFLLANALMDYSSLYDAFDKYLDFDASRPHRTVPASARKEFTGYLTTTKYALHNALRCEIRVLKEP